MECPAGDSTDAKVTMLLALYEYTPGALVSYECFHDVHYATMLSGNGVKTVQCSYDELHEPLRPTMLSEKWAHVTFWLECVCVCVCVCACVSVCVCVCVLVVGLTFVHWLPNAAQVCSFTHPESLNNLTQPNSHSIIQRVMGTDCPSCLHPLELHCRASGVKSGNPTLSWRVKDCH